MQCHTQNFVGPISTCTRTPGLQDFTESIGDCTIRQTDHQNVWLTCNNPNIVQNFNIFLRF